MDSIWTEDRINSLGTLWTEGHSTAEIGRRLGVTKNAVVGKAHRLSLTPRPSPVKFSGPRPRRRTQRIVEAVGPTCSWPLGHPGDKDFHFCNERPMPGKPYCADHAAVAYIRPKKESIRAA